MALYIKRAVVFFPITLLFFASLYRDTLMCFASHSKKIVIHSVALVFVIISWGYRTISAAEFLFRMPNFGISRGVEHNSRQLDKDVPQHATIYAHSYGFRFFWQTRHRLISADDQLMNNQMIIEKALKEGGQFVLLARRGDHPKSDTPTIFSQIEASSLGYLTVNVDYVDQSVKEKWIFKKIKTYFSTGSDSGKPDIYYLIELLKSGPIDSAAKQPADEYE
jgi:hypothetical protein